MDRLKYLCLLVIGSLVLSCAIDPKRVDARVVPPTWEFPEAWTIAEGNDDMPVLQSGYRQYVKSVCQWCEIDNGKPLAVHHIYNQRLWKDGTLERRLGYSMNNPTNLVTLHVTGCHLIAGHKGNYYNAVTNFWRMLEESRR